MVGNPTNVLGAFSGSNNRTEGTAAAAGLEVDGNGKAVLKDNGGPSFTIALLSGSPAIDAGLNSNVPSSVTTDQRGTGFPRIYNTTVDIGAFEYAPPDPTGAAGLVVTTDTDVVAADGLISLREAINNANANADQSAITFDSTVFGTAKTIALGSALPNVTTPVTITGSSAGVTVDGVTKGFNLIDVNQGNLTLTGLTFTRGYTALNNGFGGLTVSNCTIISNAYSGVSNSDTATIINCTIVGNQYGITTFTSNLSITNATVIDNTNSGVIGQAAGGPTPLINMSNSLVLGSPTNVQGNFTGSNNRTTGTVAAAGLEVDANGKAVLKNNGGPTFTVALLPGSPAIDAGSNALIPSGVTTDQRGTGFARIVNTTVDMGAFEAVAAMPTITSFTPSSGGVGTSVTITGTSFTGATGVSFNGTPATFAVNSATQITATVPTGTTKGPISVTTPNGTATSASSFNVTETPFAGRRYHFGQLRPIPTM